MQKGRQINLGKVVAMKKNGNEVKSIANNPLAKNLARVLNYYGEDYKENRDELVRSVKAKFGDEAFSAQAIDSWIKGPKLPQLKNLEMLAWGLNISDPWDLFREGPKVDDEFVTVTRAFVEKAKAITGNNYINLNIISDARRKAIDKIIKLSDEDLIFVVQALDNLEQINIRAAKKAEEMINKNGD